MLEDTKIFEEILNKMRSELFEEIKVTLKSESDTTTKDKVGDIYDLASDERDRELSLLISDRDREKISEIDEALERIEDGSYGSCEECETDIPKQRLLIIPFARLCVNCKSEHEKQGSHEKKFKEEREYRKLAFTTPEDEDS
jgi:RNA polymerase-binding transcription factor